MTNDTFLDLLLGNTKIATEEKAAAVISTPKVPTIRNIGGRVAKPWEVRTANGVFVSCHYSEKAAIRSFKKL